VGERRERGRGKEKRIERMKPSMDTHTKVQQRCLTWPAERQKEPSAATSRPHTEERCPGSSSTCSNLTDVRMGDGRWTRIWEDDRRSSGEKATVDKDKGR